jgi:beta-xylosidase
MVLLTGRPYAVDWALEGDRRPGAVLQAFFPGEEGGTALAGVISGRVNPSGRLPVSLPRAAGAQPYSYLHPILGGPSDVTSTDSTPLRPFGFGLSYTTFAYGDLKADAEVTAGAHFSATVTLTNTGDTAGTDVVQLYGHDLHGSVARPVVQLLGYQRVALEPGQSATVTFTVPTQRFAFSDRSMTRVVEPGDVEVWVGSHCSAASTVATATEMTETTETTGGAIRNERATERREIPGTATPRSLVRISGGVHRVTLADPRTVTAEVAPL